MNTITNYLTLIVARRRLFNGVLALTCALLMGYALYSQHVMGLEPCPLCVMQRFAMIATGLLFFLAFAQGPGNIGARVYALLLTLTAGSGAAIAARHVWLQGLPPDEVPACGPGLDYMLDVFPLADALRMVFTGSGECAEVQWRFLGLSMPEWVLASFVLLLVAALVINIPGKPGPSVAEPPRAEDAA